MKEYVIDRKSVRKGCLRFIKDHPLTTALSLWACSQLLGGLAENILEESKVENKIEVEGKVE